MSEARAELSRPDLGAYFPAKVEHRNRPRRTESLKAIRRHLRVIDDPESAPLEGIQRPLTRGECVDGPRPCPWVGCRHNLFLDVNDDGGIRFRDPTVEPDVVAESCSLDVADRGGLGRRELSELLRLTPEWTRQLLSDGLEKLRSVEGLGEIAGGFEHGGDIEYDVDGGERAELRPRGAAAEGKKGEAVEAEAEAFADRALALRIEGVPLANAWTLANGCDREEEEELEMATSNGTTTTIPLTLATADETVAELVEVIETARSKLKARRAALLEDLALVSSALGEDPPNPSRSPRGDASPEASPNAKPRGRPPSSTNRARIVAYVSTHPGQTTAEIARGLGEDPRRIAVVLHGCKATNALVAAGSPQKWSAP